MSARFAVETHFSGVVFIRKILLERFCNFTLTVAQALGSIQISNLDLKIMFRLIFTPLSTTTV